MVKRLSAKELKARGLKEIWGKFKTGVKSTFNNEFERRKKLALEGPRKNETKRFLDREGNDDVAAISVGRKPVFNGVKKGLNYLSLGQFDKTRKDLNYDDVYHNYMIVTMKNGKKYRVEKNHVVEATPVQDGEDNGISTIAVNRNLTLKQMMDNAAKNDSNFWGYDAQNSNCQIFVDDVLKRNHLESQFPEDIQKNIVKPQNSRQLIESLPSVTRPLPRLITDFAGAADRFLHGDGMKQIRKRKQVKKVKPTSLNEMKRLEALIC
jgi:hypothetical protein